MSETSFAKLSESIKQKRQENLQSSPMETVLPTPETSQDVKKITLKLPANAHKELRRYALDHDTSMQDVLVDALNHYLHTKGEDWQVNKPTKS